MVTKEFENKINALDCNAEVNQSAFSPAAPRRAGWPRASTAAQGARGGGGRHTYPPPSPESREEALVRNPRVAKITAQDRIPQCALSL